MDERKTDKQSGKYGKSNMTKNWKIFRFWDFIFTPTQICNERFF